MLNEALYYSSRGWRVHPCIELDKRPLLKDWPNRATTDAETIQTWFKEHPKANLALATGKDSGVFVLDIDVKGNQIGSKSLNDLESEIGPLPETLEARTGTGGRHLFFEYPKKREVRNKQAFRPGLDIRGEGGYVLLAPSIHPDTKQPYSWPYGTKTPIRIAPDALLDIITAQKPVAPQIPSEHPIARASDRPGATKITERASLYLRECEPAVQGQAGHNALLWAARAMVIGFELSDTEALALLWQEFNPRCSPPWDRSRPEDIKDFERKVAEARKTPGEKPSGWLLEEYGLQADDEALLAFGKTLRESLLKSVESAPKLQKTPSKPVICVTKKPEISAPVAKMPDFKPFPMDVLPGKVAEYGFKAAEAHCVDPSFVGLPMLVVTSAAMGNAFRLRLKEGFEVPPTLWGGIVAASGTNKSGPLRAITAPLRHTPPVDMLTESTLLLNPQSRLIVSDATLEAVVNRLASSPRGLCTYRAELAGWVKSFNAYKKGGGDEQAWIEFWDAHEYQLDRKTNQEEVFIAAAAVSVIGGIQPKVLIECFDPGKFASGLVPRLLIVHPPMTGMHWTEIQIDADQEKFWHDLITTIRIQPFAGLKPDRQQYVPNVLLLSPTAKDRYIEFFDEMSKAIQRMDEMSQTFASKSRVIAARLALCHHALKVPDLLISDIQCDSMEAGIELARWFLNEQIRVYGLACVEHQAQEKQALVRKIARDFGGRVTLRALMRSNGRKFPGVRETQQAIQELVDAGLGYWAENEEVFVVKND